MNQIMFNSASMPYDMFQYGGTPASFYPPAQTSKLPVDYNTASSIDQTDRRRRRSGSTSAPVSKDKETIPNMHQVSQTHPACVVNGGADEAHSVGELRIGPLNVPFGREKKSTSRDWSASSRTSTKNTKTSSSHTPDKPMRWASSMAVYPS
jgi:hypothetical protein